MIFKYRYGKPFPTGAVIKEQAIAKEKQTRFQEERTKDGVIFRCALGEKDCVFGLGEAVRGINKRGWIYQGFNVDDPFISESRTSLYGSHNFLLVYGEKPFGAYFDTAAKAVFDIGYTKSNELAVTANDVDLYLIEGDTLLDIVKEFRFLIGESYIPPMWGMGYIQSRWGYRCEADVRAVAEGYKKADMPLDMICLDIDYMDSFKDFTVNKERFPDLKGLSADLKKDGIRLIPIIDAAVKLEEGYSVYDEGVKNGYFCKGEDGEPFVLGVWPGDCVLPDVLNPEARRWFGSGYKVLLDQGIEGFWNDMNEPAIFYSKTRLNDALRLAGENAGTTVSNERWQEIDGTFCTLKNNLNDYASFYHETEVGRVNHIDVHNLYGSFMTRAAGEYFSEYDPDKRYLLFSRSSFIGMHRYGGIWTGDNASWWSHILLNLKMLPSLNMCGFLFAGADLGGFGENTTEDLLLRWLALGIFEPLMRNHNASPRDQECYKFEKKDAFRRILGMRYALLPYLYGEYVRCAKNGDMLFRPLCFDHPDDDRTKTVEDQLYLGESLMICPVYEQNAEGRYVYLPERMMMIRMKSGTEYTTEILEKGDHYLRVPLDEVVFFLREGHALPLAKPAKNVDSLNRKELRFVVFSEKNVTYSLYTGDGYTKSGDKFEKITLSPNGERL